MRRTGHSVRPSVDDGLCEPRDRVVGVHAAAVAGAAARAEPDPDQSLLAHLQQVRPAIADRDRVAADLADRLGRAGEPLRAVRDDELGALDPAVLLVGEEHQDEVALGEVAGSQDVGDGGEDHGVHVLHVHGTPAPQHPVADLAGERIDRPVRRHRGHDVEVAVQHEGGLAGVAAADTRHHVRAARDRLVVLGLQAQRLEVRADVLGGLALAFGPSATPVRGVEADQILRDADDFGQVGTGRGHAH